MTRERLPSQPLANPPHRDGDDAERLLKPASSVAVSDIREALTRLAEEWELVGASERRRALTFPDHGEGYALGAQVCARGVAMTEAAEALRTLLAADERAETPRHPALSDAALREWSDRLAVTHPDGSGSISVAPWFVRDLIAMVVGSAPRAPASPETPARDDWEVRPGTHEVRASCPRHPSEPMRLCGEIARCSECGDALEMCNSIRGWKHCAREKGHRGMHVSQSGTAWAASPSNGGADEGSER